MVALTEWTYVKTVAKTPVRYFTTGTFSVRGPECVGDPSGEMPESCYLHQMEKSLADKHASLDDWGIFWRFVGFGIYMVAESLRVLFMARWNKKRLLAVLKSFMKRNLNDHSRGELSEATLTQMASQFAEWYTTLPTAKALRHFVALTGIYAALSAIPLVSSPYV